MSFSQDERTRFHNLLKLAAESPFEGERENALEAAKRLAARFGMSLEEAASAPRYDAEERAEPAHRSREREQPPPRQPWWGWTAPFPDDLMGEVEAVLADKARREAALRAARARGLDADEIMARRGGGASRQQRRNRVRMNPISHARILLTETHLPFREVAQITGLDVWQVVGLKLKLRANADRDARARDARDQEARDQETRRSGAREFVKQV